MDIILILFAILIMITLFLGLSIFLQRSALKAVVKLFRKNNALEEKDAKTSEELGIMPRNFVKSMFKRRDYRPQAIDLLISLQVVKVTEDNKLYFSEDDFSSIQERSSKIGRLFLPSRI